MGPTDYGYIPDAEYNGHELWETVGYVEQIWSEQEGGRHAVYFKLRIYLSEDEQRTRTFMIYLDVATTVALTQFQLVRDALWSKVYLKTPHLVRVHFNFVDENEDLAIAYWVGVLIQDTTPVTVGEFYAGLAMITPDTWRVHIYA